MLKGIDQSSHLELREQQTSSSTMRLHWRRPRALMRSAKPSSSASAILLRSPPLSCLAAQLSQVMLTSQYLCIQQIPRNTNPVNLGLSAQWTISEALFRETCRSPPCASSAMQQVTDAHALPLLSRFCHHPLVSSRRTAAM